MRNNTWIRGLIVVVLGLAMLPTQPAARANGLTIARVQVLRDDASGVTIQADLPALTLVSTAAGSHATLAGWPNTTQAGAPDLPQWTTLMALPPGTQAVVRSITVQDQTSIRNMQIAPVPTQRWINEPAPGERSTPPQFRPQHNADPAIYAAMGWFPTTLATLGTAGAIRQQHFVPLQIAGAQWNPQSGELRSFRRITVVLDFVPASVPPAPARPDPLWNENSAAFINDLPAAQTPQLKPSSAANVVTTVQAVRLTLPKPGLYALSLQQLSASGVPPAWTNNPAFIRFFRGDNEIPRTFNAGSFVFYLPAYDTRQSDAAGVMVRYTAGEAGLVPASRVVADPAGAPNATYNEVLQVEEQVAYVSHDPAGDNGDHWWWRFWFNNGNGQTTTPISVSFTLDTAADSTQGGTVRVRLHGGVYGPTHTVAVRLNGTPLTTVQWSGRSVYEAMIAVPAGGFVPLTNTLALAPAATAVGTRENGYLDWVKIEYARAFTARDGRLEFAGSGGTYAVNGIGSSAVDVWDITAPNAPHTLAGYSADATAVRWADATPRRYLVQAQTMRGAPQTIAWLPDQLDLHSSFNAADHLVITYNPAGSTAWSDALGPLVARRTAQGLRSQVIDVQWMYDQFGDGRVDPQAIRAFLAYAYQYWAAPAPSYVLLVGDGNNDPHDYAGNNGGPITNYIPPFLANVDPWLGETAADNRYVTLVGDDDLPDLHLGRFPAATWSDVSTMVSKTLAYEQTDPNAAWLNRLLLVADDFDGAGDFHQLSDDLLPLLPSSVMTTTQYFNAGDNVGAFRTALVSNINAGQLFVNYIGHAGIDVWASPSLYNRAMVASLQNASNLPIMLPMTCYAGYYHDEFLPSLAEREMLQPNGGAVASWSPTGLGISTGHDYLNRGLLNAVYNQGMRRLGPATLRGKITLAAQGLLAPDLLDTYLIFGDPALLIPLAVLPIGAVDDLFVVGRNTSETTLAPTENDLNPYQHSLVISAISAPQFGTATITRAGTAIVYTPSRRYVGLDSFIYTVYDPTNGSRATATIQIEVIPSGSEIFLPQIQR